MPARPSDKGRMRVNTLGWWVGKAGDRGMNHESLLNVEII
jgi:hypothetical protein